LGHIQQIETPFKQIPWKTGILFTFIQPKARQIQVKQYLATGK